MNYRKGFRRIGAVLTYGSVLFWVGVMVYGSFLLPAIHPNGTYYNDYDLFSHFLLIYGVVPVGGYWLLYWIVCWIVAGFRGD